MIRSSCLCEEVVWEAGALEQMSHCHCSMCRKSHGTPFATYVSCPEREFQWVRGEEQVRAFESSPGYLRRFCGGCGSVVPEVAWEGLVSMPAGNLDDDPIARPECHIFVASKANWHAITDSLPRSEAWPEGWGETETVDDRPVPPPSVPGALQGSCLCGDIAFEVTGDVHGVVLCHCSRCRKGRSAAHGANLFVTNPDLRWIRGRDLILGFKPPDAEQFMNHFCSRCGSIMPRPQTEREMMGIPAGCLDGKLAIEEKLHIFVDSMAPWFDITDDLPRVPEGPRAPPALRAAPPDSGS